ncbi:MAG TPA: hypothetical protein VGN42_08825 [Pirellulales bacterium]|nr:hypothetical protein [Pirellulales bacterium]
MAFERVLSNASSIMWLSVYALTATCFAIGTFRLGLRPGAGAFASARFWATGLLMLGVLPALDAGEALGVRLVDGGKFVAQAALLLIGSGAGAIVFRRAVPSTAGESWRSPLHGASRLRSAAGLAALAAPTLLWASHRLFTVEADAHDQTTAYDLPLPVTDNLREVAEAHLQTDCGTRVPAFRLIGDETSRDASLKLLKQHSPAHSGSAILKGSPETHSNCHGWVFADGQFIIQNRWIDRILKENEYSPVETPETGDLIVYRDVDGSILHTGVVKATGRDGFALIESKWGLFGSYLHEPRHQAYSEAFAFYRSPRRGHRLQERLNYRLKPLRAPVSARLHPPSRIA